jgi:hypothetical protein
MKWVGATPLLLLVVGCAWGEPREDVPGDYLGEFAVDATLAQSTCGAGAMGALDSWSFDIRLSRQDRELFWVNGQEVIPGTIDDDSGEFGFETRVEVEVVPPDPPDPGCSVNRFDAASGTVEGSELDISAFSGSLSYTYQATETSDCLELVLTGELPELPCTIEYEMDGSRTEAPSSED